MGRELTDSLQSQWRMEQQRTEQIAALAHDLKTPLTVIQGNADLLAEDALSADQQTQVEAILRGTERAQPLSGRPAHSRRSTVPYRGTPCQPHPVSELAETARALCAPAGMQFILNEQWQGTLCAAQKTTCCGLRKTCWTTPCAYTPARRHCHPDGYKRETGFYPACDRYRPRLHARSACKGGGNALHRRRPQRCRPPGLGLYFATKSRAVPRRDVGFIQPSRCARCLRRAAPADLRIVLDVDFALC